MLGVYELIQCIMCWMAKSRKKLWISPNKVIQCNAKSYELGNVRVRIRERHVCRILERVSHMLYIGRALSVVPLQMASIFFYIFLAFIHWRSLSHTRHADNFPRNLFHLCTFRCSYLPAIRKSIDPTYITLRWSESLFRLIFDRSVVCAFI